MESLEKTRFGSGSALNSSSPSSVVTERTDHTYDPLDRVQTTTRTDHDGRVKGIEYDYDIQGNRTAIESAFSITCWPLLAPGMTELTTCGALQNCSAAVRKSVPCSAAI